MKAQWQEGQYGTYYLKLGQFKVCVHYDSSVSKFAPADQHGFKVSFEDTSLVARFKELEQAKKVGEKLARKKLQEALERLGEE